MGKENIAYVAGREEGSTNINGCGATHTVPQKNNTSCPRFKLGYIKTHYLVIAILNPISPVKCYRSRLLLWTGVWSKGSCGQKVYALAVSPTIHIQTLAQ